MKRALVAITLSLACAGAFAQAAGSSIPPNRQQGNDATVAKDKQQLQKDKARIRADRQKAKRDKRKLKEDQRKAAAAKG
jgi:hypothetical protein